LSTTSDNYPPSGGKSSGMHGSTTTGTICLEVNYSIKKYPTLDIKEDIKIIYFKFF